MIAIQDNNSLLNLPDLLIVLFLLFSVASGARRGLTGTIIGLFGRLAVVLGANWLAGMGAPMLARTMVKPITEKLFESEVIQGLDGVQETAVQAAASMAEGLAYLILMVLCLMLLSVVLSLIAHSLHLLTRFPPLGALNRLAGAAIGLVGGVLLIVLALWLVHLLRPEVFTTIGWLSPSRIEQTRILNGLLTYFPIL
ncbi:MAG: CvpA family protein [Butyricicoccus pullicaecorum]|nr:CvpA family protein [Butyricicoccus pullicaecorum]